MKFREKFIFPSSSRLSFFFFPSSSRLECFPAKNAFTNPTIFLVCCTDQSLGHHGYCVKLMLECSLIAWAHALPPLSISRHLFHNWRPITQKTFTKDFHWLVKFVVEPCIYFIVETFQRNLHYSSLLIVSFVYYFQCVLQLWKCRPGITVICWEKLCPEYHDFYFYIVTQWKGVLYCRYRDA